jgi:hypothetical protein
VSKIGGVMVTRSGSIPDAATEIGNPADLYTTNLMREMVTVSNTDHSNIRRTPKRVGTEGIRRTQLRVALSTGDWDSLATRQPARINRRGGWNR